MTARIYMFRGSEADNDQPMVPTIIVSMRPAPLSDDEHEQLADGVFGWPTTRRFPRTLHAADSAFPRSPEYADPFERFHATFSEQDRQVDTLSQKWLERFGFLIGIAALAGIGVLLAWRG